MIAVDDPYVADDGHTYVSVIFDAEAVRSQVLQTGVPATPVPIEQVWVEHRLEPARSLPGRDPVLLDRLVSLDSPPARTPHRISDVDMVAGRRIIVAQPERFLYDRVAVTEPHRPAEGGDIRVGVTLAFAWHRWSITGEKPRVRALPIFLLWVE